MAEIVHVITNFSARGGAEAMLARLVNARPERAMLVGSLMEVSGSCQSLIDHPDVRFQALGARSAAGMGLAALRLARLIRRERPAAILCWMYHANAVGALAAAIAGFRGPLYWNVRHSWHDPASETRSVRIAVAVGRPLCRLPTGMIFNSWRSLEQHADIGYRHERSFVIPNGYLLPPAPELTPRRPRRVGMAARLHPQKDFGNFLSAAARVQASCQDAEFVAAGRGVSRSNPVFMRLMPAGTERVELLGEVEDMAAFYRSLDLCVLSSAFGEAFPNVLAEAMSFGVPCVTTDIGDAGQVVGDTGLVVRPADSQALADAILSLLAEPAEQFVHRRRAARQRIEAMFDIESVARRYDEIILQPSSQPPSSPGSPR